VVGGGGVCAAARRLWLRGGGAARFLTDDHFSQSFENDAITSGMWEDFLRDRTRNKRQRAAASPLERRPGDLFAELGALAAP